MINGEDLGIASALQARRISFAERHPALARFFSGKAPQFKVAKEHRVTVNLATGARTVERNVNEIISDPAYKGMPSILAIMRRHEARQFREAQERLRLAQREFRWEPLRKEYAISVVQAVCGAWGVEDWRVMSPSRKKHLVHARDAAYMILHETTKASGPSVGKFFNRDHTTLLHGVRVGKELLKTDPDFRAKYNKARATLGLSEAA